ncbi:MAG: class I SAM-dependent methyltransferase [Clostridium sp.]|jgi:SAM-dependent methyltransferase|nr:class I SAM-dependent methyltransferase [Clostridium sp.]
MKWDAELYETKHNYSSDYGKTLFDFLPPKSEAILDIGCGIGDLTERLKECSDRVLGVDASPDMIDLAKKKYPNVCFRLMDAEKLEFAEEYDVVFSNAAFHWILDQRRLLSGIFNALKPCGKLICEFGGAGNVARIRGAYQNAANIEQDGRWFFPTEEEYRELLSGSGFVPESVALFDRPTPLGDGEKGLENWIRQFYADDFGARSGDEQCAIMRKVTEKLRPTLFDSGKRQWIADYRRIRVVAGKGDNGG